MLRPYCSNISFFPWVRELKKEEAVAAPSKGGKKEEKKQ